MTADPHVQAPGYSQSYNRYSYLFNNPLGGTDPTGYRMSDRQIGAIVVAIIVTVVTYGATSGYFAAGAQAASAGTTAGSTAFATTTVTEFGTITSLTATGAAVAGAASGAAGAFAGAMVSTGGDLDASLKSAAYGAVGGAIGGAGFNLVDTYASFATNPVGNVLGPAVVGCVQSSAQGGKCGSGALSAGVGAIASGIGSALNLDKYGNGVLTTVAGGVSASLGGGSFAEGASIALFGYLFNHCAHAGNCWQALKDSASMATDWALGNGVDTRVFGPGSTQVTDMMDAPGVNGARDFLYKKNATSVTNYRAGFGLIDYLTTSSPTQQFVGSYRVDVFTVNQGAELMFVLNNNSSFRSFGYGVTPAWERGSFAPGGNMRQT